MAEVARVIPRSAVTVGCTYCVYELLATGRGPCPVVPTATLSVSTPRGIRQLCDAHAKRGEWGRS